LTTVTATMLFKSHMQYQAFYDWFKSKDGANAGAAWFTWEDCRTHTTRTARLVAAQMGPVIPVDLAYAVVSQTCALEYVDDMYA